MSKILWNLEPLVDIEGLEKLDLDICWGISKSSRDYSTRVIPHYEAQGRISEAIAYKNTEGARIAEVKDIETTGFSSYELERYNSLNYNQKRKFLELYCGGYNDGEFVRIKFTKNNHLDDKFSTFYSGTTEWTNNAEYFGSLIEWINKLPFTDIGRILIFITKHYLHGDLHYDRRDDWLDGRHHFIWFNPFGRKHFNIYHEDEIIPVTHRAAFFDTGYIHGSGIHTNTVYSIRVDGQLEQDFCKKAGIPWHPR